MSQFKKKKILTTLKCSQESQQWDRMTHGQSTAAHSCDHRVIIEKKYYIILLKYLCGVTCHHLYSHVCAKEAADCAVTQSSVDVAVCLGEVWQKTHYSASYSSLFFRLPTAQPYTVQNRDKILHMLNSCLHLALKTVNKYKQHPKTKTAKHSAVIFFIFY